MCRGAVVNIMGKVRLKRAVWQEEMGKTKEKIQECRGVSVRGEDARG